MQHWRVIADDRDSDGKIKIGRSLSDLLPPAVSADDDEPPAGSWGRWDVLAWASVAVAGALLFVFIGQTTPALPAPVPTPLILPTAAPTATRVPTPPSTITPEPTSEPIIIPPTVASPPTPCDPLTAPFQVKMQVMPIGSVVGVSCISNDEAQANAQALADAMIATATAEAK
jgi:hypothetical protein